MTPHYPGHDPEASAQKLRWRNFDTRFDYPDQGKVLPPSAHAHATPFPDGTAAAYSLAAPAPVRGATRQGLRTACGANAKAKARVAADIGDFPVRPRKAWKREPEPCDPATCKHGHEGWQRNGNARALKRLRCRACLTNHCFEPAFAAKLLAADITDPTLWLPAGAGKKQQRKWAAGLS